MKLLIVYLTDNGRHYTFRHFTKLIDQSAKKADWKILILGHDDDVCFYNNILKQSSFNYESFNFPQEDNYMEKVRFAVRFAKRAGIPYMMKCDNDLFFRGRTLDYMIDNLELLQDTSNLTLGPTLSSGIPTVEYFMNQFLDDNDRLELQKKFIKTPIEDIWGATFVHLNEYTIQATSWNGSAFFDSVKDTTHYYKGIHPVRVNIDAITFLNQIVIRNKSKFYEDRDLSIVRDKKSPYLCNSIFCIRTDIYDIVLSDKSLFVDSFDEVPLNKYAWKIGAAHLFVKNGFGLHMYYNTVPDNRTYEQEFCNSFFDKCETS